MTATAEVSAGAEKLYKIGPVARSLGVSPEAIRAWERRELIAPPRRTERGKRLFTAVEVEAMRAAMIARARRPTARYEPPAAGRGTDAGRAVSRR